MIFKVACKPHHFMILWLFILHILAFCHFSNMTHQPSILLLCSLLCRGSSVHWWCFSLVSLLFLRPNPQVPNVVLCIEGYLTQPYGERMTLVSPESWARAAGSSSGRFYCCHLAPQDPVALPIHPHCFCFCFFMPWCFLGFSSLSSIYVCVYLFLFHMVLTHVSSKPPCSRSPLALVLSQQPVISATCLSVEQRMPHKMQMVQKLLIWSLIIFHYFHAGFISSLLYSVFSCWNCCGISNIPKVSAAFSDWQFHVHSNY